MQPRCQRCQLTKLWTVSLTTEYGGPAREKSCRGPRPAGSSGDVSRCRPLRCDGATLSVAASSKCREPQQPGAGSGCSSACVGSAPLGTADGGRSRQARRLLLTLSILSSSTNHIATVGRPSAVRFSAISSGSDITDWAWLGAGLTQGMVGEPQDSLRTFLTAIQVEMKPQLIRRPPPLAPPTAPDFGTTPSASVSPWSVGDWIGSGVKTP